MAPLGRSRWEPPLVSVDIGKRFFAFAVCFEIFCSLASLLNTENQRYMSFVADVPSVVQNYQHPLVPHALSDDPP
jgi:hypothetical protein